MINIASQYSTFVYGALTLSIESITVRKQTHTAKQVVGKQLRQNALPGAVTQDWILNIKGRFIDANRHADRETLESYDNMLSRTLTDGIHDGEYFITNLTFNDSNTKPTSYEFTLNLVQE